MHDATHLRPRSAYGLDLSGPRATVVRAVRGRRGVRFETVRDERGPAEGAVPVSAGAGGEELWAGCLPVRDSIARWLTVPFPSLSKARKVMPSVLDVQLPFPLERCVYAFPSLRRTPERQARGLAVAARREDLEARLAEFRARGVDPQVVDHEGLALWHRAVEEFPADADTERIVAYLGGDRSVLVVGAGAAFESAHGTRDGADAPAAAGATRPFVAWASRVLRGRRPRAAERGVQWLWVGPGAEDAGLLRSLEQGLELGEQPVFRTAGEPATFLARALAARALIPPDDACNLRTGELEHPAVSARRSARTTRAALAALASGLLLCCANLVWWGLLAQRERSLQTVLQETARDLTGLHKVPRGQELLLAGRALEDRASSSRPFLAAFAPSRLDLVLDVVQAAERNRLTVEALSVREGALSVRGTAGDWEASQVLAARAEQAGFDVRLDREDAGADERVHFTLTGTVGDGG